MISRREFITLLGGAAAAWPIAAGAQLPRRVGVLMSGLATETAPQSYLAAFVQALRQLGWVEGQNLQIDVRWNGGDVTLARTYAAQLLGLQPGVILVVTSTNLDIVRQATATVPVVFVQVTDPVAQGFVASLTKPGGNLTGFSGMEFSIGGKWLDLLKEAAPNLTRVAMIFNPETSPQSRLFMRAVEGASSTLGVQATAVPLRIAADIEPAIQHFALEPNGGLILPPDAFIRVRQKRIGELASRHRLPSISAYPDYPKDGGLMSYTELIYEIDRYRQAASYVDRILKGAKPGDLPVQQPVKYTLAINLKTAKALGLNIPLPLLGLADEVIE
jgi:putative ABC transport system substrate-binding protein